MHNSQLNRVLKLVRRTGDKLVIFDKENDSGYAVMNLDQYENLLDEATLNPSDFDSDDDDEEFFAQRPSHGFEPISSVMKERWHDDELVSPLEEKAPWENGWQEQEVGELNDELRMKNQEVDDEVSSNQTAVKNNSKDLAAEEVSLADVPHDEEEETFLLEPVE